MRTLQNRAAGAAVCLANSRTDMYSAAARAQDDSPPRPRTANKTSPAFVSRSEARAHVRRHRSGDQQHATNNDLNASDENANKLQWDGSPPDRAEARDSLGTRTKFVCMHICTSVCCVYIERKRDIHVTYRYVYAL